MFLGRGLLCRVAFLSKNCTFELSPSRVWLRSHIQNQSYVICMYAYHALSSSCSFCPQHCINSQNHSAVPTRRGFLGRAATIQEDTRCVVKQSSAGRQIAIIVFTRELTKYVVRNTQSLDVFAINPLSVRAQSRPVFVFTDTQSC